MENPLLQYNFLLEIDGTSDAVAGFTEVSGINMESDIVEYREGSDTATVRKLAGMRKYGNITLKRGYTTNNELWEWRKTVIDGFTVQNGLASYNAKGGGIYLEASATISNNIIHSCDAGKGGGIYCG